MKSYLKNSSIKNASIYKNPNIALSQTLFLSTNSLTVEEKLVFLSTYFCAYADLMPDKATLGLLKELIKNVIKQQVVSYNSTLQILIYASSILKNKILKKQNSSLSISEKADKFDEIVQNLLIETISNKKYIKQKWQQQEKKLKQKKQISLIKKISEEQEKMNLQYIKKLQRYEQQQKKKEIKQFERLARELQKQEQLQLQKQQKRIEQQRKKQQLNCQICLQEIITTQLGLLGCGHMFHKKCIRSHLQSFINQKKMDIPCPSGCEIRMDSLEILDYIDGELYQKYDKFSFDHHIQVTDKNASWCPTANCTAVFTHDGFLTDYNCPVCKKKYCLNCRCIYHKGMTCDQYRITNTYTEADQKFQKFVIGAKFKQCPNCKVWVEKKEGCSSIKCNCGIQFCYNCGGTTCPHGNCSRRL